MTSDPRERSTVEPGPAPPLADTVLATRLRVPPVPASFVRRPRLAERLTRGLRSHPLLLVNGPAGAGKTLLVSDWVRTAPLPGPVAWLTLEEQDDGPGAFGALLVEALRRSGVLGPAGPGLPHGAGPAHPGLPALLAGGLAARRQPLVLVLDEYERVPSPDVAADLHALLRHCGDGLRLVLVSRNEPLLPLHRYRAADQITEVRAADLAFTPDEAAVLLRRHGLGLSEECVRALTARTEGWAAGLRLCALAAEHAPDQERYLKEFEAGHSVIADFLLAEVLDAQPAATRDLLLRTSLLDRTHPALANALTGRDDAERTLDELARANTFVTPLGHSWYRHHPLFAEILQVHLRARHPGLAQELHATAARWLHGAGLLDEALRHAAAADEWELAAGWLVQDLAIGRFFGERAAAAPAGVFAAMPPGTGGPAAELVRAARAIAAHDTGKGLAHLDRALQRAAATGGDDIATRLSAAFLRLMAARSAGTGPAVEEAAHTVERLGRRLPERWRDHPELSALSSAALATARLWEGHVDEARAGLLADLGGTAASGGTAGDRTGARATGDGAAGDGAAATVAGGGTSASDRPLLLPESHGLLALAELLKGTPGRAESHALHAVREAQAQDPLGSGGCGLAHLVLAEVAAERDDLPTARVSLRLAEADGNGDPLQQAELDVTRARLALYGGDPRGALALLGGPAPAGRPQAPPDGPPGVAYPPAGTPWEASPWARDRATTVAAAALLDTGDARAALEALDAGRAGSPEAALVAARAHLARGDRRAAEEALPRDVGRTPAVAARALLVRAESKLAAGQDDAALRLVAHALAMARPDRLRRAFLEAGPWLPRFLRGRPFLTAAHAWLPDTMRDGAGRSPATAAPVEPLTAREQEVLERVAQLMSTAEVAAELNVSVNTVKTHLKNINRKLCTTRRADAVRRARRLHLL
ncbi:LuxR C-terminal-related transcriptional regulator [Streptomyces sp. CB01881]|uniref:LuxR C-terminal-related transcriptional regulator n=1 Tax=Streptomyces sp. CB01881 TaxID=2078691 RepID=UPI000CDC4C6E|nr:LuxR C-terminal-related transcriptional regulator [Streptomyces sp. CB01881]AUY53896.1 helix-turn-helix transcriptional regulator [Streptomyces sp. CB01881]TYC76436.1 helix-turn-helix transcriptional regulator [Streptomyces sp. CB01881]